MVGYLLAEIIHITMTNGSFRGQDFCVCVPFFHNHNALANEGLIQIEAFFLAGESKCLPCRRRGVKFRGRANRHLQTKILLKPLKTRKMLVHLPSI